MSTLKALADWPELPLAGWIDTRDTLQMWLQIVGKVRLRLTPSLNHSWHSTFYLTARGLTTSPIPYGNRSFHIDLDLMDHRLLIAATDGASGGFALQAQSVAAFYARLMDELTRLGLPVRIFPKPNELPIAVPFPDDDRQRPYDTDAVHRFWLALSQADRVLKKFRTHFIGKCSPVHLFWGGMDLAVTSLLLSAAGIEHANAGMTRGLVQQTQRSRVSGADLFRRAAGRLHLRALGTVAIVFVAAAAMVAAVAAWLLPDATPFSWTTLAIGDAGYLLFALGLLNSLVLVAMNRPWSAVKALVAGVALNLVVAFVAGRAFGGNDVPAGLVAGAALIAVQSSVSVRRALRRWDYAVAAILG